MAFGMEFGGDYGKLFLSLFRIVFVIAIIWYLYKLTRSKYDSLYVITLSLIIAGAIGNLIDSAFYGMVFNSSEYQVAQLFSAEGGYSTFLHGRVVDMLYFPILEGHFPSWFPIWGNEDFIFFRRDQSPRLYDLMIHHFRERSFSPRITQEGTSHHTALGLAAAGLGCTVVPASAANQRLPQGIRLLRVADLDVKMPVNLVWRREQHTPVIERFADLLCGPIKPNRKKIKTGREQSCQ